MRVLYLGTPQAALPTLTALTASGHDVVGVVTRPDRPRDRARGRPAPSPVKQAAQGAGLPVVQPERSRDPELPGQLAAFRADIGVTCAFGMLLPKPVLDVFPRGVLNLHFSLLPAYRGAAPVQHALLDGLEVTGVTVFRLDEGMDTGPVLTRAETRIEPDENTGALTARLAVLGADLVVRTLDALDAGTVTAVPQPDEGASHAPKLTRDDARLDPALPAVRLAAAVRAFTPAPGAWTSVRGRRLKVLAATALPPAGATPGTPAATGPAATGPGTTGPATTGAGRALPAGHLTVGGDGALLLGTADGLLRLDHVQPEGKRPMRGEDFARGLRLASGEELAP